MQKTHPLRNGHYFRFDEKTPQTGLAGHRFYRAEKVFIDAHGRERPVDAGEKYILIECCKVWNDDLDFRGWVDRMTDPEQAAKLPKLLMKPVMTLTLPSGHAAWIARCPDGWQDGRLLLKSTRFHDDALMAEGYAYGAAMAEKHRLPPTNILFDEVSGAVLIDTAPGMIARERHGAQWLEEYLRAYSPSLAKYAAAGSECRDAYYAFRDFNSRRRDLQDADDKTEPVAAEMNFVLTRKKSMMPMTRPDVSRARHVAALNQSALRLSDIFPDQSPLTLMGLGAREETGLLYLTNLTDADWRCSRYGGMTVRANGEIMLRAGEEITVPLAKGTTLTFSIRRFETRRIRESRPAARQTPISPAPNQSAAAQNPAPAASVQAKPAPVGLPFDDLYEYDAQKLPPIGGSVKAWEKASGKRVRIEVHAPDCKWIDPWTEQMKEPLPPCEGWMGLINLHSTDGCTLLVREEAQTAGFVQAGSPALKALEPAELYAAGSKMMRILHHAAERNWLPARFEEGMLLVHPGTKEALFTGGIYLARPMELPFDCTMGYGAPETYRSGVCADMAALHYAAAVWLYRLLVGGYPMEGGATRSEIRGTDSTEAQLEQALYGEGALFVFDPENGKNSIRGLGASFDEQVRRYEALDERIRAGFEQTFCRSLHARTEERWSPAKWADVLSDCCKGG